MKEIAIAVVSLVVGAIVGPYVNWGIEKRKQKQADRRELIAKWRKMVYQLHQNGYHDITIWKILTNQPDWTSLKPHVSPELLARMEDLWRDQCTWEVITELLDKLSDDIACIEKRWKFV